MPDAAGPRFNVAILKDDGSDSMTIYRTDLRALDAAIESLAAVYGEGLLSARPAFGAHGRFYKPTDAGLETVIYYDDGTAWRTIGAAALIDAAAAVGSLRTLGAGAQQAAAGNHQHGASDLISGSIPAGRYGAGTVPLSAVNATGTPGSGTYLRGDGTWAAGTIGALNSQTFTSSGTWTSGASTTYARVLLGAGGGGSGSVSGGGGGDVQEAWLAVSPSTAYTITIGAGGGTASNGGNSSFGALLTVSGGLAGSSSSGGNSGNGSRGGSGGVYSGNSAGAGGGGAAGPGASSIIGSSTTASFTFSITAGDGGAGSFGYGGGGGGLSGGQIGRGGAGGADGGVGASANTCGGGGGGNHSGGSGICIVQWLN